jgi:hypothetical protein
MDALHLTPILCHHPSGYKRVTGLNENKCRTATLETSGSAQ